MEDPGKIAEVLTHDFDLSWTSEDPASLETHFRSRLAALSGTEEVSERAELLTQIARAEAAQGKLAEASETLAAAAKLLSDPAISAPSRATIRLLLEEGRLLILLRTPSQARSRFAAAWTLAVNGGDDFFVVDIARRLAEIEPMKLQEEWLRKAIETAEKSSLEKARAQLGALYADLGWRLFDLRQFEASLQAHQSSLAGYRDFGTPADVFRATWSVGRLLRQLERTKEALQVHQNLLLEVTSGEPIYGRLCEEAAECLLALRRQEEAQKFFARAFHELSQSTFRVDRHPLRLKRLKDLGKVE